MDSEPNETSNVTTVNGCPYRLQGKDVTPTREDISVQDKGLSQEVQRSWQKL